MNRDELKKQIDQRWPGEAEYRFDAATAISEIVCDRALLPKLCGYLFLDWNLSFAGLIVEEGASEWQLRYVFYGEQDAGWVHVFAVSPLGEKIYPSIVKFVHAADWHEREAEDLFGIHFEGHPRLGDFILHDDAWQENVEPMRHKFNPHEAMRHRKPDEDWRPHRIVQEPGAFVMPVGPKYSGVTESVHFLLETVGEDVIRSTPRLFYKWRGIEKLAEGKTPDEVLLLAERFAATTAFAHGLAFCQAVEIVCGANVPPRAKTLRIFLAELERLRQHAGAIQEICESTALAVANAHAGICEEELLRISCELTGHRYLFGLLALGGLTRELLYEACRLALEKSQKVLAQLNALEKQLRVSSSFLDRLEEVGIVPERAAMVYGLLGPIARASGIIRDLRRAQPYLGYENFQFDVPGEKEGDGYARLRILFAEARQSVRIMEQAVAALRSGSIREPVQLRAGAALGWVEAPRGGTFHWVRLDENGKVARYRVVTPSFANWHGFHLSVEKFAFQDFPIMLSTFDLSVSENDR
ncbi:MAG TPA: NADH-quinone oxidoreductase subunit C [Candidatus Baltobacteraceae bacterium]|nr:NADH-quinone oxidoreductase subunit C [Candidatus Baltobacteraceae bacterium]